MDNIAVMDFITSGFPLCFLIGLCSGLLISGVVMAIRAVTGIFKHIATK